MEQPPQTGCTLTAQRPKNVLDTPAALDESSSAESSLSGSLSSELTAQDPTWPKIDGYVIRGKLGAAGMGEVYRAYDRRLHSDVALKVPQRLTERDLDLFIREARALAKVDHPHVVKIHSLSPDPKQVYFTMDLVEGMHLATAITRLQSAGAAKLSGPRLVELLGLNLALLWPETRCLLQERRPYYRLAALWMAQAAEGLQAAFEKDVLHRDIKPSNLMLATDGRIVVVDFGLARSIRAIPSPHGSEVEGTYEYIAPERAACDSRQVDHRADIWALGATLYELLTLHPAYRSRTRDRRTVLNDIATKEFAPPRKHARAVPRGLEAVCLKAMKRDPDERYGTWTDMALDLRKAVASASQPNPLGGWALGAVAASVALATAGIGAARIGSVVDRVWRAEPPGGVVHASDSGSDPIPEISTDKAGAALQTARVDAEPSFMVAFNESLNSIDPSAMHSGGVTEAVFREKLSERRISRRDVPMSNVPWTLNEASSTARQAGASHLLFGAFQARPGPLDRLGNQQEFFHWYLQLDVQLIRVADGVVLDTVQKRDEANTSQPPRLINDERSQYQVNGPGVGHPVTGLSSYQFSQIADAGEFTGDTEKIRQLAIRVAHEMMERFAARADR